MGNAYQNHKKNKTYKKPSRECILSREGFYHKTE